MYKKIALGLLLFILATSVASAQSKQVPDTLQGGLGDIEKILVTGANWMYTLLLALAVVFFLVAAFKYLTSGGGEEVGKAHKMIVFAIVAIAVAMLAKGVSFVVSELITGNADVNEMDSF